MTAVAKGLDYWHITVLASVRLGCDLDYDKLQDLAEQTPSPSSHHGHR